MVTTLSRGYDGCASSALAFQAGCKKALTFTKPGKYLKDSGVDIAQKIGYTDIIEGDGEAYKSNSKYWEAEASAIGDVGSIVPLNEFDEHTSGNLFMLGIRGDHFWDVNDDKTNREFDFRLAEFCMGINPEHALNQGSIVINVPFLLGESWPEIYEISKSEEMKPWRLYNDYDRPIPRRILEEAGVPRDWFGHRKTGVGFSFRLEPTSKRIQKKMSKTSFEDYLRFKKNFKCNKAKWIVFRWSFLLHMMPYYINYAFNRFGIRTNYAGKEWSYRSSPNSTMLIQWGMDKMIDRYSSALKQ